MSRAKLERLHIDLPLLPTTSVGSFPKPTRLQEMRSASQREQVPAGELEREEIAATKMWVETQERLGVDVLVDGEMYRGDMVAYFAERMAGFKQSGLVRSYGNRYYHKPIIVERVRWHGPVTVEWWRRTQAMTVRPVKGMLTGPYTIMDWSFNEFYEDRRATCMALALEIRKEVKALIEAGARIIQIDEPAISVRPDELTLAIEAMTSVTDGLPAYFVTHICYGDFGAIYPELLKLPVDNFDLEMANSNYDLLTLFKKTPFTKDLTVGVVDVHRHQVEDRQTVMDGIRRTLAVIPKEQLWIDPDCGLKTRTVLEATAKLKVVCEAAAALRAEI